MFYDFIRICKKYKNFRIKKLNETLDLSFFEKNTKTFIIVGEETQNEDEAEVNDDESR